MLPHLSSSPTQLPLLCGVVPASCTTPAAPHPFHRLPFFSQPYVTLCGLRPLFISSAWGASGWGAGWVRGPEGHPPKPPSTYGWAW